jgi:hypothetical protein
VRDLTDRQFVGKPWEEFLGWFGERWIPGNHIALIGPTGEGKTTFAAGILRLRKWVLALDPKGEDDTLSAAGFTRIKEIPPPEKIRNEVAEGKPARLVVGGGARNEREDAALERLMRKAVQFARHTGGWTLYVDEYQILADQRMMRLGTDVERMLIAARRDKTSVVTSFQAPAWVPKAATRQATQSICLWPTRDRVMVKNVAEAAGRPWHEIADAVDQLPRFHVLVIPTMDTHGQIVLASAPKIN